MCCGLFVLIQILRLPITQNLVLRHYPAIDQWANGKPVRTSLEWKRNADRGSAGDWFRETMKTFGQAVERRVKHCLQYANIWYAFNETFEQSNIWHSIAHANIYGFHSNTDASALNGCTRMHIRMQTIWVRIRMTFASINKPIRNIKARIIKIWIWKFLINS